MMRPLLAACAGAFLLAGFAAGQTPQNGRRVRRLLIHNATVIDGNGTPASGPKDILIENNLIAQVIPLDPVAAGRGGRGQVQADAVIDATGKYVLPGLINNHAHLQEERGGKPQPIEYELNIWLACGITAIRDVGSPTPRALELRKMSAEGEIAAPRIFVYPMLGQVRDAAGVLGRRTRLARSSRTHSGCMTCWATSGSGRSIGTGATWREPLGTQPDQRAAKNELFAAARLTSWRGTCVHRSASGTIRASVATTSGSGACGSDFAPPRKIGAALSAIWRALRENTALPIDSARGFLSASLARGLKRVHTIINSAARVRAASRSSNGA